MNDRTMVKVECRGEILFIRTVSWGRKSPSRFALLRREFQQLEQRPESHLVCSDCGSFASLRLAKGTDGVQMLEIQFTWLQEEGRGSVRGWQESVRLPYGRFTPLRRPEKMRMTQSGASSPSRRRSHDAMSSTAGKICIRLFKCRACGTSWGKPWNTIFSGGMRRKSVFMMTRAVQLLF